jgi:hypothetical protein
MDVLTATASEITAQTGNRVIPLACDVRDPDAVARLFDGLAEATGGRTPSLVVNNAAGNFVAPFERLTPGGWRAITEIVLNGELGGVAAAALYRSGPAGSRPRGFLASTSTSCVVLVRRRALPSTPPLPTTAKHTVQARRSSRWRRASG